MSSQGVVTCAIVLCHKNMTTREKLLYMLSSRLAYRKKLYAYIWDRVTVCDQLKLLGIL